MAGWNTNGMGTVGPITVNGVVQSSNGSGLLPEVVSHGTMALDTQSPGGAQPQTVAASAAQIAMIAIAMQANVVTMTGSAPNFAVPGGALLSGHAITPAALTTAVGATATIVFSSTTLTALSNGLQFDLRSVTNPVAGMVPISIVYAAGTATIVFQNQGSAALNGTMMFSWHL